MGLVDGACVAIADPVDECAEGTDTCDDKTSTCVDHQAGYTCQCLDRYIEQSDGTCEWDVASCDTLDIDWKGQTAVITELAVDVVEARINQWRLPETQAYTGFVIFARKHCGDDFLQALADGRVSVDFADKTAQYAPHSNYYRRDGGRTSTTLQYTGFADHPASNAGTDVRDQAYLILKGISTIDFASNTLSTCLTGAQIGSMAHTDVNVSGCAGWQKNVGFREKDNK